MCLPKPIEGVEKVFVGDENDDGEEEEEAGGDVREEIFIGTLSATDSSSDDSTSDSDEEAEAEESYQEDMADLLNEFFTRIAEKGLKIKRRLVRNTGGSQWESVSDSDAEEEFIFQVVKKPRMDPHQDNEKDGDDNDGGSGIVA